MALDLAAIAAEAGYADQAHLTRECGRLVRPDPGRPGPAAGGVSAEFTAQPGPEIIGLAPSACWPGMLGVVGYRYFKRPRTV